MDRGQACTARADPEIALPILIKKADPVLWQTVGLVEVNGRSSVIENQIHSGINGAQDEGAVAEFEGARDRTWWSRVRSSIFHPLSILPPADALARAHEPCTATA